MKKRILSLTIALALCFGMNGAVFSASAVGDGTQLAVMQEGSIKALDWIGDEVSVAHITDDGKFLNALTGSDGKVISCNTPIGISTVSEFYLGNKFEVEFEHFCNNQNAYDDNYAFISIGALGFYINHCRKANAGNSAAYSNYKLSYGVEAADFSSVSSISDKIIAASGDNSLTYTDKKFLYKISFDNGGITVYRDGEQLLSVSAADFAEAVPEYSFDNVKISIKMKKRYEPWTNGHYFSFMKVSAIPTAQYFNAAVSALPSPITGEYVEQVKLLRTAYDMMTADEQAKVTTMETFLAAEGQVEIQRVIDAVDALPETINDSNKDIVADVRAMYDSLTEDQKNAVTNYSLLLSAEQKVKDFENAKLAQPIIDLINKIPDTVTYGSVQKVYAARYAYNSLPAEVRAFVENYAALTAAETKVETLKASLSAQLIVQMINELPETVTLEYADDTIEINGAYGLLSDEEKTNVTNYSVFTKKQIDMVKLMVDYNKSVSPKIVTLVINDTHGPEGSYLKVPDGVTVYAGDTIKIGSSQTKWYYTDSNGVEQQTNSGWNYNTKEGWGGAFQPYNNGAVRNVSTGTVKIYRVGNGSNAGDPANLLMCEVTVIDRPEYDYDKFNVGEYVAAMISVLPAEISDEDASVIADIWSAYDSLDVYSVNDVYNVRTLINSDNQDDSQVMIGDITGDKRIDSNDILVLQQSMLGMAVLTDVQQKAANINRDAVVDSQDLLMLQQHLLGIQSIS